MHLCVHPGFHKTGTTSLQQALAANRAALAPAARVLLKGDMPGLTEAARAYARSGDAVNWALYRHECARLLETLDPGDPRPVLVSAEDLSGAMPFRHGQPDYAAAPRLMAGLRDIVAEVRPAARLSLLYTTRAAAPWVRSCHAQHLAADRMTETLAEYTARALPHADLDAMADRIAAAVAPVPLHRVRLEDLAARPLGPLDALLDLAGIDPALRARLVPVPPANRALPRAVLDALLALNRTDRPWNEIRAEKAALIRRARQTASAPATARAET